MGQVENSEEKLINELTDEEKDLIRKAREEYNAYYREYYKKNKEQIRQNQANYWLRKAREKQKK